MRQYSGNSHKEILCSLYFHSEVNFAVAHSDLTHLFVGTQSIYVKTWGCSHNNSDSEYMAGQLAAYGYNITGKLVGRQSHSYKDEPVKRSLRSLVS